MNIVAYPKYDSYRESDVEWWPSAPSHWTVKALKHGLRINNGQDHKDVLADDGYPVYDSGGQFAFARDYLHDGDAILLGRKGTIDKPLHVRGRFWSVDTMFYGVCKTGFLPRFAYYYCTTIPFFYFSTSTALPSMTQDDLKNNPALFPSLTEQRAIAAFLDSKCATIDEAVRIKQEQIKLLRERRQILIQQAVTRGLNPDAPMKDSGIDWIGQIPAHWEVRPIRYAFRFRNNQRVPLSGSEREHMQGKYPYYGASGVIDYVDDYIFDEALILIAEDGANLLSKSTPLAFVARGKYWVNNHAHILEPLFPGFEYWAEMLSAVDYTIYISGSAQPKLTRDRLGGVRVPVPPPDERKEIIALINQQSEKYQHAISIKKDQIAALKEYKTSLINAAVTGKIKVI